MKIDLFFGAENSKKFRLLPVKFLSKTLNFSEQKEIFKSYNPSSGQTFKHLSKKNNFVFIHHFLQIFFREEFSWGK